MDSHSSESLPRFAATARMSPGVVLNPISQIRKGYKLVGTRYLGDYPTRVAFLLPNCCHKGAIT